jgi:TRAP transporter 4TM/12TM fusion protein
MKIIKENNVWIILGACCIVFHICLIFSGLVPSLIARPMHMALALPWIFVFPAHNLVQKVFGISLTVIGIICCLYIAVNEGPLSDQYGFISGWHQLIISFALLCITIEMARRAIGWPLPCIATLFLFYGLLGDYIPGEFGHAGIPINSFLGTLIITEGGLWGKLTGVSVSIVAIFVIFGAVLNAGEAGKGFMNIAVAAAGRLKGGGAKVSVVASALFGSISGSASANVASTGMVTLPAMEKLGYPKRVAAAVEAVASTGGQIMPPLMGAGAFVMVELTGIPYEQIILAALLPAILYFWTVWVGVNQFAEKYDLAPYSEDMQPSRNIVIKTTLFFLVPFSILLVFIFTGFTPQYAAAFAILSAALLLFIGLDFKFNWQRAKARFSDAALFSGQQVAMIASIILCASIIVGVLGITGLGIKITSSIISIAGNNLWPALLLTALACIVLGMEVPTTAAYVICVSVAGPALTDLGLEPLIIHLFIFWFALLSTITPPVCGGVFIAASMVNENWLRVATSAMALGLGLYIVPLAMIKHPSLIQLSSKPFFSLIIGLQLALGLLLLGKGLIEKHWSFRRVVYIITALAIIFIFELPQIELFDL